MNIKVHFKTATSFFADVAPRTSFYPGVNGTSHHGKCVRLSRPIRVKSASPALPFSVTAVSEKGILLTIEEDEMVSFRPPLTPAVREGVETEIETDEGNGAPHRLEIPIIAGYYFAEGLQKGQPVRAYIRTTGQLV
jgi:hypothetical protein